MKNKTLKSLLKQFAISARKGVPITTLVYAYDKEIKKLILPKEKLAKAIFKAHKYSIYNWRNIHNLMKEMYRKQAIIVRKAILNMLGDEYDS